MKKRFRQVLSNAINGGLDSATADIFMLRQVRMVNLCCFSAWLAGLIYVVIYSISGKWQLALLVGLGLLVGAVAIAVFRGRPNPKIQGWAAATLVFAVVALSNFRGAPFAEKLSWFYVVPTFAGLAAGTRALLLFGTAAMLSVVYFFFADGPADAAGWSLLWNRLSALFCLTLITAWLLFERARSDRTLHALIDQLQRANRAKNDFVARMSHEIRTPINALIGMAQILRGTKLDAAQRDYVETIRSSGESLAALVGNILDFARIESAKARLEPVDFDPRTQLEDIAALFAQAAADKNVQLLWQADIATPMRIHADETRLRQILVNLVNNALKFTDKGQIVIDVHAQVLGAQATLIYLVEDSGIGIAPDKLDYVFEPFAQADETATRNYGGAGLGLAICRDLAALMGGTLTVSSQLGKGTTFRLALPVAVAAVENPAERKVLDGLHVALVCPAGVAAQHACGQLLWLGASVAEFSSLRVAQAWAESQGKEGQAYTAILCHADVLRHERRAAQLLAKQYQNASGRFLGRLIAAVKVGHDSEWGWPDLPLPLERRKLAAWFAAGSGALAPSIGSEFKPKTSLKGDVLVVEDNVVNQKVIRLLLERFGVNVEVAADGREALAALARRRFDLVLMDCEMPNMNGYDATSAIRGDGGYLRLPIVAVTAHAGEAERQRCLDVGMNEVLAKPVREEALFAALTRWLPEDASMAARFRQYERLNEEIYRFIAAKTGAVEDQESIAAVFERTVRQSLDGIDAAVFREDAAQVRAAAHGVKGSAAAIGAERLSKMSEELEKTARGRELALAKGLAQAMRQEFLELLDLLSVGPEFKLGRAQKPPQRDLAAKQRN